MRSQLYIPTVSAAGLLVIGHCISTLIQQPVDIQWIALAVLALFTGSLTIKVPAIAARLSVSETFVFASILLFGICAGTITIALEILIAVAVQGARKKTDPQRLLFNVSSGALSIWVSGHAFYYFAGIPPLSIQQAELHTLVVPLAILSSTHFLLNSGLISVALSFQRRQTPLSIWRTNFSGLSINYFAGASLAALFVSYTRTIDLFALSVIIPLLLVSYLTFKTSLGRIEDATRHVDEVQRLYLSTIETLATAIDAKDQVTHGHIRRVQQLALALARELGVRDPLQLQALEAAALLHDTGKLVVPEHILNKPGKLTKGEFEKMKQHARVGAEILSSINFPYPVVPIVRHHHENWDGTGYPDGIKGIEIPVGARVLAVVDCFDALTSDRPYRPRMTEHDAMGILIQRRGSMYDPLVVDTFVENWRRLCRELDSPEHHELPQRARMPKPVEAPPATPVSGVTIAEPLTRMLDTAIRSTGASLGVVFAVDSETDVLVTLIAHSADGPVDLPRRIPLGSGIAGWVAANKTPVLNAEASLDFRDDPTRVSLVRSLCVPVWVREQAVGVLALYSDDPRGFNEEDKALLAELASRLSDEHPSINFDKLLRARDTALESAHTVH